MSLPGDLYGYWNSPTVQTYGGGVKPVGIPQDTDRVVLVVMPFGAGQLELWPGADQSVCVPGSGLVIYSAALLVGSLPYLWLDFSRHGPPVMGPWLVVSDLGFSVWSWVWERDPCKGGKVAQNAQPAAPGELWVSGGEEPVSSGGDGVYSPLVAEYGPDGSNPFADLP